MAFSKSFSHSVLVSSWHCMHKDAQLFLSVFIRAEKRGPHVSKRWCLKGFRMHRLLDELTLEVLPDSADTIRDGVTRIFTPFLPTALQTSRYH